jgi:hypothetical protein
MSVSIPSILTGRIELLWILVTSPMENFKLYMQILLQSQTTGRPPHPPLGYLYNMYVLLVTLIEISTGNLIVTYCSIISKLLLTHIPY